MVNFDDIDNSLLSADSYTDFRRRKPYGYYSSGVSTQTNNRVTKKHWGRDTKSCNNCSRAKKKCQPSITYENRTISCRNCDDKGTRCSFCPVEHIEKLREIRNERSSGRSTQKRNQYVCDGCFDDVGYGGCEQSSEVPSSCTSCLSKNKECTFSRVSNASGFENQVSSPDQGLSMSASPPAPNHDATSTSPQAASKINMMQNTPSSSTPTEPKYSIPDEIWSNGLPSATPQSMPQELPPHFDPIQEREVMFLHDGRDMVFPLGMEPSFSDVVFSGSSPSVEDNIGPEIGSEIDVFAGSTNLEPDIGSDLDVFTEFTNFDPNAEEVQLGGLERGSNIVGVSC